MEIPGHLVTRAGIGHLVTVWILGSNPGFVTDELCVPGQAT